MIGIPALAESDLAFTLEGGFAIPVTLIDREGNRYEQSLNGGRLRGMVRRSYTKSRSDGRGGEAERITVHAPMVRLRRTSLPRIPATGESWVAGIPKTPGGEPDDWYALDPNNAVEINDGRGTVKLYLAKLKDIVLLLQFRITPEGVLQYRTSDPRVRFRVAENNLEYTGSDGFTAKVEPDGHCYWRENAAA